jgi:uroporphyrinogen-III decarboxylase
VLKGGYRTPVERLIDEVAEIKNSTRNIELKNLWENFYSHKDVEKIPITVNWSLSFYAQTLGIDLKAMFSTPQRYLEDMLKILLYRARNFMDDNPLGVMFPGAEAAEITADQQGDLMVYFGPPFEPALFGLEAIFDDKIDPRQGPNPIMKNESDLDDMNYPDFYQSGMMPKVIEFYEEICNIVKGRLEVVFPIFCRGPFSIAWALRGLQNCVVDMYRRPDFFHKMMTFITESRIRWEKERERYLGRKMRRAQLDNDEVDGDIISKQLYEKFIFPYEEKTAEFYENGIFYFHSCGNLSRLYNSIQKLPGLGRIEVSPVSDLELAARTFSPKNVILHKRLDPRKDVYVSTNEMATNLRRILQQCSTASVEIDACPLDPPIERIQEWIHMARQVTAEYRRTPEFRN